MSILLSLLLTSLFYITPDSRTCVCSAFSREVCESYDHCMWNENIPLYGAQKAEGGKCRAQKWFECHIDPNCVITGNNPLELGFEEEKSRSVKLLKSYANEDWPYCCKTEEPNQKPQCPQLQGNSNEENILAAKSEQPINIKRGNNLLSMNMIGKLIALITFIVLISIGVCYKFINKDYKNKELQSLKNNFQTYESI